MKVKIEFNIDTVDSGDLSAQINSWCSEQVDTTLSTLIGEPVKGTVTISYGKGRPTLSLDQVKENTYAKYPRLDFEMKDVDIARKYDLSRAYVLYLRKKITGCAYTPKQQVVADATVKIQEHAEELAGKTTPEVKSMLGLTLAVGTIRGILNKLEIGKKVIRYPWETANWDLPNLVMASIWAPNVANAVKVVEYGRRKYGHLAVYTRLNKVPLDMIESEQKKAAAWRKSQPKGSLERRARICAAV